MISKKRIIFIIFFFFLCLTFTLICNPLNLDEVWSYGFSHNIYSGLLPYQDFNMVIPPFYPFFMSLFFHLFGSSMLTMHIVNAVITCIALYLLFLLLDKKAYIVLLFFFFPIVIVFPNYNFFLVFLVILLLYLETLCKKNTKYHYLIGLVLGIAILTKHTVGICLLLPCLYYWKDRRNLLKRVSGVLLPIFIFLTYLLLTKTTLPFVDLCILGLFDFASNKKGINLYLILYIILLLINIYLIKKDKTAIVCYYVLAFSSILIPIFDVYHFVCYFLIYLIMLLLKIKKDYIQYFLLTTVCLVVLACFLFQSYRATGKVIYPNKLPKFEYRFINEANLAYTKEILAYMKQQSAKEIIFLDPNAYYFKLISGQNCGYLDLINRGNWGIHGSERLLTAVKKKNKDVLFFINYDSFAPSNQTDKRVLNYVIKQYKKVKVIGWFHIFSTED